MRVVAGKARRASASSVVSSCMVISYHDVGCAGRGVSSPPSSYPAAKGGYGAGDVVLTAVNGYKSAGCHRLDGRQR